VSAEYDECSRRPSTSKTTENVQKIWQFIHEGHRQTIHELTNTTGISYRVCQESLTGNLNMVCIAAKFVPPILTNDKRQRHIKVHLELWEKATEDTTYISRIIMGDESWIYSFDPETKQ
jgi:hypothetical protein